MLYEKVLGLGFFLFILVTFKT